MTGDTVATQLGSSSLSTSLFRQVGYICGHFQGREHYYFFVLKHGTDKGPQLWGPTHLDSNPVVALTESGKAPQL